MFCQYCGRELPEDALFCPGCGKTKADETSVSVEKPEKQPMDKKKRLYIIVAVAAAAVALTLALLLVLFGGGKDDSTISSAGQTAVLPGNRYAACYEKYDAYVLETSNSAFLSREDVAGLTPSEAHIALQEIYARHGHSFDEPEVQAYFDLRDWYTATQEEVKLNAYEKANALLLKVIASAWDDTLELSTLYGDYAPEPESYAIAKSNTAYLGADDLKLLTKKQLVVVRNEIYARHGYVFENDDLLTYFYGKQWYKPTTSAKEFSDDVLNKYEKANVKMIQLYEKKVKGVKLDSKNPYRSCYREGVSYVFSGSSSRKLNDSDLAGKTKEELCVARNEIFARHGYVFTDANLLAYFLQFSWYNPNTQPGKTDQISLSSIETANVNFIKKRENALKNGGTDAMTYVVSTGKYQVCVPESWRNKAVVIVTGDTVEFYEKTNHYSEYGGYLYGVSLHTNKDYTNMPRYTDLGVLKDSKGNRWYVVATGPTDVQYSTDTQKTYQQMRDMESKIWATLTGIKGYTFTAK